MASPPTSRRSSSSVALILVLFSKVRVTFRKKPRSLPFFPLLLLANSGSVGGTSGLAVASVLVIYVSAGVVVTDDLLAFCCCASFVSTEAMLTSTELSGLLFTFGLYNGCGRLFVGLSSLITANTSGSFLLTELLSGTTVFSLAI